MRMDKWQNPNRREFLRSTGMLAGGMVAGFGSRGVTAGTGRPDLAVVEGEDPKAMVKRAVDELGGMKRFVSRGDVVAIKPNMAWVRRPEQAANTNPDVIVGLVEMAFDAGAKTVKVFDRGAAETRDYREAYAESGIAEAARKAGAETPLTYDMKSADFEIKDGKFLKQVGVYRDALECDCFINVPVAKHHGITRLTLCMKNHMGIIASERREWHRGLDQALVDFASAFRPDLNVLDAFRIMLRRGPAGGSLQNVLVKKKCIAGVNQASVDAFGATLFDSEPSNIGHIALAGASGIGEIDLEKLRISRIAV